MSDSFLVDYLTILMMSDSFLVNYLTSLDDE